MTVTKIQRSYDVTTQLYRPISYKKHIHSPVYQKIVNNDRVGKSYGCLMTWKNSY